MVWATSMLDRRLPLAGTLTMLGLGHIASALSQGYALLLASRILTMAFAALVTPVAASTVVLIVRPDERAAGVAYVFTGFSLAVALGLPLITFLSRLAGWQAAFAMIGAAALVIAVLLIAALPAAVQAAALGYAAGRARARPHCDTAVAGPDLLAPTHHRRPAKVVR